ncbi:MAG: hypothetical protein ACRENN_05265, partial [Candidatus Eiseniibacteriota bacterium]
AVRRSASGVLGEVRTLSPSGVSAVNPQVQVAANGDAVVAWEQGGRVIATVRRASTGVWDQPRYISGLIPLGPHFADGSFNMRMNAQGDAEFAWLQTTNGRFSGRVFVRSWSHTGRLGPKTSVGVGERSFFSPQVAVFSDGAAIVAWTSPDGETCGTHPCVQLYARPISAASVPGPTEAISPADQRAVRGSERLAVNAAGDVLFGWKQEDQSPCSARGVRCSRVLVRARSAAGELADRQIASEGSGLLPEDLQLGIASDGGAVVSWLEPRQGLQLAERSAGGDLGPVQTLVTWTIATRGLSLQFQLAPDGHGLFGWLAGDGTRDCPVYDSGCERMHTMDRAPNGSLGPIDVLSPPGQDAISSRVALAPNGASAAVWGVGDLGYNQPESSEYVQGAFRPAPGSR